MRRSLDDRTALNVVAIVLAVVLYLSLNVLANTSLRIVGIDLTEDGLYTLADGTREVLTAIDEPVVLRFYFSALLQEEVPQLATYGNRVRELLERYVEIADGGLELEVYRPGLFSPEEDQAIGYGLQSLAINVEGDPAFLGLVGTNSTDDLQVIPFFSPDRERFLEYDLTKLISNLANPEKPAVALIGALPLAGDPALQNRPWLIHDQLREFFTVRTHPGVFSAIDDEFDVLMLALPAALGEKELYAIDQYVLGSGSVLIFVDPLAEMAAQSLQTTGETIDERTLSRLFDVWGIEINFEHVVGDRISAQRIRLSSGGRTRAVDYLPWLALGRQAFNTDDVVTRDLANVNMASVGIIERRDDAAVSVSPLIVSSPQSMRIAVDRVRYPPDPFGLLNDFVSEDASLVLAARLSGTVPSAFPDGPPREEDGSLPEVLEDRPHRATSETPINVIVVADSDLLSDSLWARVEAFLGQQRVIPHAANAEFVINALDNLRGSGGLINLRSRSLSARPFHRLEAITREAESRYRATERDLNERLAETESRIREIPLDDAGTVILSGGQFDALQDFRAEAASVRQELREVQLALREDIERAETWIKAINIGAIPIAVGILAIALGIARRVRMARRYGAEAAVP